MKDITKKVHKAIFEMDTKLTAIEEMDLIRKWFDKKTTYEVWRLLPSQVLRELIRVILKDNKEDKKWKL